MRPVFDTIEGIQDDRGHAYLYRTLLDEQGQAVIERVTQTEEVVSRAWRIRHIRHVFPQSMAVLQARLFADLDTEEVMLNGEMPDLGDETTPPEKSNWILYEQTPFSHNVQDYHDR